ncbi:MAG TPA: DUF2219 family protein [Sneathiellales bacterium]|nr:DUF2219 family protein [Sneathiellales bacterium]
MRPSLSAPPAFEEPAFFGWYIFGGADAQLVLWDIFLEGNTVADSHSVSKKHVVGSAHFGATIVFGRTRLTFTQVFRTKEFDGQDSGDRFGTVALSVNF